MLEALTGARLRDEKFADVEDWFKYAEEKVDVLAKGIGGIQRPRFFKSNFTQTFDVGQFEQTEREKIQLARAVPMILQPNFIDEDALSDSILNLNDALVSKLQTLSVQFERGANQAVNYVPVRRAVGGIVPSGIYKIAGETVTAKLVLRRDDKEISRLTITAPKNEIAEKLMQAIIDTTQKK